MDAARLARVALAGFGLLLGVGAGAQTAGKAGDPALIARTGETAVSEKQKAMQADSEKLVRMAAELKVMVDKSNKNELSVEVVKKAEAIEVLAKSLKQRMREAH